MTPVELADAVEAIATELELGVIPHADNVFKAERMQIGPSRIVFELFEAGTPRKPSERPQPAPTEAEACEGFLSEMRKWLTAKALGNRRTLMWHALPTIEPRSGGYIVTCKVTVV